MTKQLHICDVDESAKVLMHHNHHHENHQTKDPPMTSSENQTQHSHHFHKQSSKKKKSKKPKSKSFKVSSTPLPEWEATTSHKSAVDSFVLPSSRVSYYSLNASPPPAPPLPPPPLTIHSAFAATTRQEEDATPIMSNSRKVEMSRPKKWSYNILDADAKMMISSAAAAAAAADFIAKATATKNCKTSLPLLTVGTSLSNNHSSVDDDDNDDDDDGRGAAESSSDTSSTSIGTSIQSSLGTQI